MSAHQYPLSDIRHPSRREERKKAAKMGWFNWYTGRGRWIGPGWERIKDRADLKARERLEDQALRRVSWRRAL